jgi:hypothetical protein
MRLACGFRAVIQGDARATAKNRGSCLRGVSREIRGLGRGVSRFSAAAKRRSHIGSSLRTLSEMRAHATTAAVVALLNVGKHAATRLDRFWRSGEQRSFSRKIHLVIRSQRGL